MIPGPHEPSFCPEGAAFVGPFPSPHMAVIPGACAGIHCATRWPQAAAVHDGATARRRNTLLVNQNRASCRGAVVPLRSNVACALPTVPSGALRPRLGRGKQTPALRGAIETKAASRLSDFHSKVLYHYSRVSDVDSIIAAAYSKVTAVYSRLSDRYSNLTLGYSRVTIDNLTVAEAYLKVAVVNLAPIGAY